MFILRDTFNDKEISRHFTLLAAIKAERRHAKAIIKNAGPGHYVTYSITENGKIDEYLMEEIMELRHFLDCN